ncbi:MULTISPECIES: hypothetical protein [unclassified Moritella]|uniref:hypothetical protein n=1 Tax=unclassified Moritella TaxID=2637987 RepID=UPI001BA5FFE7|nr:MULTISPECIES: hypothetical protein [unclassified Moritella]QUM85388.1 hypothetical protein HWV02_13170 [Moritella sp. 28]QUM89621.1 hypothetical protein HWV03_12805 [Moritella sp. 36]
MLEGNFVALKSELLIQHTQQFMNNKLSYVILCDYIWEILQDWQRLNIVDNRISSQKEMVFWYLVFELQFQDETSLLHDKDVNFKLHHCILFLQDELEMPKGCIGVRPNYA